MPAIQQEHAEGARIAQLQVPAEQDPIGQGHFPEQVALVEHLEGGWSFHDRVAWTRSRFAVQVFERGGVCQLVENRKGSLSGS
jgi:hypothetical protein